MNPEFVIAIDPGGTTGVAVRHMTSVRYNQFQVGPCSEDRYLRLLIDRLDELGAGVVTTVGQPIHIVCESFDFRMEERYRDKIDYTAAEVIGALRLWAHGRSRVKLIFKGAGLGKGFWKDERIKKLDLWVPGQRHAMDATRHLLRYLAFDLNQTELFDPFKPQDLISG